MRNQIPFIILKFRDRPDLIRQLRHPSDRVILGRDRRMRSRRGCGGEAEGIIDLSGDRRLRVGRGLQESVGIITQLNGMGERVGRGNQMMIRVVVEDRCMRQRIRRGMQTKLRVVGVDRVFTERVADRRQIIEPVVEKARRWTPCPLKSDWHLIFGT